MRNVPWRKWRDRRKAERVATDDLVAATDRLNLDVTLDHQRSYAGVGAASEASQGASASVTTLVQSAGTEQTGVTALQPDDIRVLDIDPARSDDDNMIQCRRRVLHLPRDTIPDDVPAPWLVQPLLRESYITLSYAWGKTKEDGSHLTKAIRCDGALLRITSNLHMALLRIRDIMHVEQRIPIEPVWIDALCIDQDNVEERNVQVQKMGHVYQSSTQVIVWLGRTDDKSVDDSRSFVRKLSSFCATYEQHRDH
ncbi:hypothetical protein LTR56_000562 [Elasticomyces elasticus]|nr:hypothetical protein LTR56_000562 [Elasticomyces elasticus]KAK3664338.1 hypothetical protein LTR22_004751 [Elasticomyces elasticus]KAK4915448.1 hypothetical protein LTR49_016436 [Elasticomyces elasticus]KAK5752831.1 hypothetical protein LTS12_017110 [Elasticomyces elasticus]